MIEQWNARLAVLEDIDDLKRLIAISARGLNNEHYTARQVDSILKYVYGVDTQLIRDQTYYVVQKGVAYLGCGGWSRRRTLYGGDQRKAPAEDDLLDPATEPARIRAFFVHPIWARKGIGSHLMRVCERAAKDAGFRSMELMATLTGELLYAQFGFETVEETDVELPDGSIMKVRRMTKAIPLNP